MRRLTTLILAVLAFTSCQDRTESPLILNNDIWVLQDAADQSIVVSDTTLCSESFPALEFLPDGQLQGQAQCNQLTGHYTTEKEKENKEFKIEGFKPLRISIEDTTLKTCSQTTQEHVYMALLKKIRNYQVKENLLILADEMGNNILTFVPSGTIQKNNN